MKRFRDRIHAGAVLARKLQRYKNAQNTIVVGVAGGGVPVAVSLSQQLHLPCEVFLSRKIRQPENPCSALGAVTETGVVFLDESILTAEPWLSRDLRRYLENEINLRKNDIARCLRRYRDFAQSQAFLAKTLITVDEGAVTGATFVAALQSLRRLGANRLIGVLPIASRESIAQIHPLTDELVVLLSPNKVENLEDYYDDFGDLSDEDVFNCFISRVKTMARVPPRNAA
jgi:putative phosphoribosyl transferase